MSKPTHEQTVESYFGEVISTYTRAQALEDGVLVDAGPMAEEAGFIGPVALTSAVWEDCVAWTDTDNQRQVYQDQSARLWDVLAWLDLPFEPIPVPAINCSMSSTGYPGMGIPRRRSWCSSS